VSGLIPIHCYAATERPMNDAGELRAHQGGPRSRSVAVIAASLLLIAGATGFQVRGQIYQVRGQVLHVLGTDRPIQESAPHAIGNTWACPSGLLTAYQSGRVYYPSYHSAPLETKPSRCYRTQGQAKVCRLQARPSAARRCPS
jgi:hypothetical protein